MCIKVAKLVYNEHEGSDTCALNPSAYKKRVSETSANNVYKDAETVEENKLYFFGDLNI